MAEFLCEHIPPYSAPYRRCDDSCDDCGSRGAWWQFHYDNDCDASCDQVCTLSLEGGARTPLVESARGQERAGTTSFALRLCLGRRGGKTGTAARGTCAGTHGRHRLQRLVGANCPRRRCILRPCCLWDWLTAELYTHRMRLLHRRLVMYSLVTVYHTLWVRAVRVAQNQRQGPRPQCCAYR